MKKIITYLCIISMLITTFTVAASASESTENENITCALGDASSTSFWYWFICNHSSTNYRISSPDDNTNTLVSDSFRVNYNIYGNPISTRSYFNMNVELLNDTNHVIGQKTIRSQYYMYGDVNLDGILNSADTQALDRLINSIYIDEVNSVYYNEVLIPMFDFTHDGYLDQNDYTTLGDFLYGPPPYPTQFDTTQPFWTIIDPELAEIVQANDSGEMDLIIGTKDGSSVFNLVNYY